AHSNNPISSNMREMRIIATNARVAFQTISVTAMTSLNPTTPTIKAMMAPPIAEYPIDNPLGCQITKTSVTKKIKMANISVDDKVSPHLTTIDSCTFFFSFLQFLILAWYWLQNLLNKWIILMVFINRIKNPLSTSFFLNQPNISQFSKMLTNGRLTCFTYLNQFTNTTIMYIQDFHHR